MTTARPKLPSVLPSQPAVQDGKFVPHVLLVYVHVIVL